jgi:hypothetical protein
VKYIDPDGRIFIIDDSDPSFKSTVERDLIKIESALRDSGNTEALNQFLEIKNDEKFKVFITGGHQGSQYTWFNDGDGGYNGIIEYDLEACFSGISFDRTSYILVFFVFAHEVGHAIDHRNGTIADHHENKNPGFRDFPNEAEVVAVRFENVVRWGFYRDYRKLRINYLLPPGQTLYGFKHRIPGN